MYTNDSVQYLSDADAVGGKFLDLFVKSPDVYKRNEDGSFTSVKQHDIQPLGQALIVAALVAGGYGMYRLGKKKK